MQGWLVIVVLLMYLGLLFLIAWHGDKHPKWLAKWRSWIYSLSIAVYCTSWTFYGTVGQASDNPWSFADLSCSDFGLYVWLAHSRALNHYRQTGTHHVDSRLYCRTLR